jgi:hypothetical protein
MIADSLARTQSGRVGAFLLVVAWLSPLADLAIGQVAPACHASAESPCPDAGAPRFEAAQPLDPNADSPHHCCPAHCASMSVEAVAASSFLAGLLPTARVKPAEPALVAPHTIEPAFRPPIL